MISDFFIRRPIFATVIAVVVVLAGLISMYYLPVAQFPEITPPTVQVSAIYPGANAETVAQTVGLPIEEQVNGVEGMMYMSSTSSSSGAYSLIVTFDVGTDIDIAAVQVQNRVSLAQSSLPQSVIQQGISVSKQSSQMVLLVTLNSKDSIYDDLYLSNFAALNLLDPLTRVPGVGGVQIMGAGDYSMRIWLDPEKMRVRQITPQEIYQAVSSQNIEVGAGSVGQQLGSDDSTPFQYTLNVKGRLESPEEFGDIILRSDGLGQNLYLRDVATIERGSASYGVISTLDGDPTAALLIYQQSGANSLNVAKGLRAKMKELSESFPKGVSYSVTLDTTDVIRDSIVEVIQTLIITILLVVMVIFLFLQNWRAVLIPCMTIPVSLIGTLAVMGIFGFSINTLTLFGLILAVAIVVDDAIVVVENASRKLDEGKMSPQNGVIEAMGEISGPIVGVVLVLLAVFLPTMFIGGISGQLYKQFAITVASATVISGLSALTFIPALCAILLRPSKEPTFFIFKGFNKFYALVQKVYEKVVEWLLGHAIFALVSFLIISSVAIYSFIKWPSTFIPTEDDGYFMVVVQLPPAASLERTVAINEQLDQLIRKMPEVDSYVSVAGFSLDGGEQSNVSAQFVVLKPWSERKAKDQHAEALVNKLNAEAMQIEGAIIFAIIPPAIPGLGSMGGLQLQLEDTKNLGPFEMQKAVESLLANFHKKPSLAYVSSQYQANVPQYFLEVDRDKVQFYGLNIANVFSTLAYYMGSAYVNDYIEFGHIYEVKIEASETSQKMISDVMKLSVANKRGQMVPFSSFTSIKQVIGQNQINRYNMYQTASINCIVMPGHSTGDGIEAMEELIDEELQGSFDYEWTSVAYQEIQAGDIATLILALALLVAFLVLTALYESWTSPVAAIIGLPIALIGAMLGCYIMKTPVSVYTQIGIILLIALSAKNGILIVQFARDFRKEGNPIREAAFEAGRVRLRPILMTSLAFVFGVMPLLFADGAGAASRIALGTGVVFGIAVNTLVATIYIPNFYEWMQRLQEGDLFRRNSKNKSPKID